MSNHVMASGDTVVQANLPLQYPLAQVSISIDHQTGRGIPGGYRIAIEGSGNGSYRSDSTETLQTDLAISSNTLLSLLNEFYRIHFFELADTYGVKKQMVLLDKATLATIATKMPDSGSKRLCIQLADYKKCVTIVDDQPAEAARLAQKIEGLFVGS